MSKKYAIILRGNNYELGKIEISNLLSNFIEKIYIDEKNSKIIYLVTKDIKEESLVSYLKNCIIAKEIIRLIDIFDINKIKSKEFRDIFKTSKWEFLKNRSFVVRVTKLTRKLANSTPLLEAYIGGIIYNSIRNTKVRLKNPDYYIRVIFLDDKVLLGFRVIKIPIGNLKQILNPIKRPFFHPSTLTPEMARLLVNMTLNPHVNVILDPFCGTGSILIDLSIRKVYNIGIDIHWKFAQGAKSNLKYYKLDGYSDLIVADSCLIPIRKNSIDGIATDPPYGRLSSTYQKDIQSLYDTFLKQVSIILKKNKRVSFLYPKQCIKIHKDYNLKMIIRKEIYVHSKLTRVLVVGEK
ncbi:MAG TPA: hypothetical protein ENG40_04585 [Thermoprotei archaeon]|nr:hypothetical protein [Thermoprotei archaeon]